MKTRADVTAIARAELGLSDASKYWRDVLAHTWVGPFPPHWCGAFALWCLRQAGLCDWDWVIGKGFLWRLKRTDHPEPGDIGYVDQPFQHHFVVVEADTHTITSVDGNQGTPGVQQRHRAANKHSYYSIAPLLERERDTDPAPAPHEHPTLRMGASGVDVVYLQSCLNQAGARLETDGQFGPKTAAAVMSFQRRAGLDADGVVGPKTWKALPP